MKGLKAAPYHIFHTQDGDAHLKVVCYIYRSPINHILCIIRDGTTDIIFEGWHSENLVCPDCTKEAQNSIRTRILFKTRT